MDKDSSTCILRALNTVRANPLILLLMFYYHRKERPNITHTHTHTYQIRKTTKTSSRRLDVDDRGKYKQNIDAKDQWEILCYVSSCTNAIGDRADISHRERCRSLWPSCTERLACSTGPHTNIRTIHLL